MEGYKKKYWQIKVFCGIILFVRDMADAVGLPVRCFIEKGG